MSVIYQMNLMILFLEYTFLYIGERKPIKFIAQTSSDLALTIKIFPNILRIFFFPNRPIIRRHALVLRYCLFVSNSLGFAPIGEDAAELDQLYYSKIQPAHTPFPK